MATASTAAQAILADFPTAAAMRQKEADHAASKQTRESREVLIDALTVTLLAAARDAVLAAPRGEFECSVPLVVALSPELKAIKAPVRRELFTAAISRAADQIRALGHVVCADELDLKSCTRYVLPKPPQMHISWRAPQ